MLAQLKKFKNGMRGADPEDISGGTMRPNALLLDDQAMLDVVRFMPLLDAAVNNAGVMEKQ